MNKTGTFLYIIIYTIMATGKIIHLNQPRGSSCVWNGMQGTCVFIHRCLSTVEDIKMGTYPPVCSFEDNNVVICCTDCDLVEDTRNLVNMSIGLFYKNGRKAHDHCLEYMKTLPYSCHFIAGYQKVEDPIRKCFLYNPYEVLAVGGSNAKSQEFQHMALLGYGATVESAEWLCGGSVISERFILTAGHCISTAALGPVRFVGLGIMKRSDPEELWQRYQVQRIFAHPQFHSPSKYHDIALLKTTQRISFNQYVLPACLHSEVEGNDVRAEATGWGALGRGGELADDLQTVALEQFHEVECLAYYPPHRHLVSGYDHRTQMCYGHHEQIRDTCQGDSGGPLQNMKHEPYCVNTIIGVTSYGRRCGFAGTSGMYTRVIYYLSWIESVVWP